VLGRIYAKLGIRSRAELGARMAARQVRDPARRGPGWPDAAGQTAPPRAAADNGMGRLPARQPARRRL